MRSEMMKKLSLYTLRRHIGLREVKA